MKLKTAASAAITALVMLASTQAFSGQGAKAAAHAVQGDLLLQLIGTVKSVDVQARRLSVESAQGAVSEWQLDPRVGNVDAIPLGSQVTNLELQPVSLMTVRNVAVQEMIPGDTHCVLRVESADAETGVVMLKDANGLPFQVRTRDHGQAAALASGSLVKVTFNGQPSIATQ